MPLVVVVEDVAAEPLEEPLDAFFTPTITALYVLIFGVIIYKVCTAN